MQKIDQLIHWPTSFLIIGYFAYWIELYVIKRPGGHCSPMAWLIVFVILFFLCQQLKKDSLTIKLLIDWWKQQDFITRAFVCCILLLSSIFLFVSAYAALLPPHLPQEYDVRNYHITLPRQHLIIGSFAHLPWSSADLFLMPIDYALTPFWMATDLPNKIPQWFFVVGLLVISARLAMIFNRSNSFLAAFACGGAVLAIHSVGIQSGTAMLDLVMAYLFLAALHSALNRCFWLAGIELAFYCWSKPFIPLQFILIIMVLLGVYLLIKRMGWSWLIVDDIKIRMPSMKAMCGWFILSSVIVAAPFMIKSFIYAGSPVFPFFVSIEARAEIYQAAQQFLDIKDSYGHGRSMVAFIQHWWLLAVPEQGVNNVFDYPLGLIYLLVVGPFLVLWFRSLRSKIFLILPTFILIFWMTWWMTSQQSRFLFVPVILMVIVVVASMVNQTRVLLIGIVVSLTLTTVSVVRAHKQDFGKWGVALLSNRDKELAKSAAGGNMQDIKFIDAAYAPFPVRVISDDRYFVIPKLTPMN